MATSTVSALDQDTYQLIATNSPRSGSETTFSGLSGYKKYMLAFDSLANTSGGGMGLRFNGSSSKYYGGTIIGYTSTYSSTFSYIHLYYNASGLTGTVEINNVNNGAPKTIYGVLNAQSAGEICFTQGGWLTTDPVTSITIVANGTYNAGSVSLYGIAG